MTAATAPPAPPAARRARTASLLPVLLMVLVAAGALAGCTDRAAASEPELVTVVDQTFDPAVVEVPVGTEVRWLNLSARSHSITPDGDEDGAWGVERLSPGESHARVFDRPGEYPYRCALHPDEELVGVVLVVAP